MDAADGEMGDAAIVRWASAQLRRVHGQPFFLGVGLWKPHLPWFVPRRYFDLHPAGAIELPPARPGDDLADVPRIMAQELSSMDHRRIVERGLWKSAVRGYLAAVSFVDAMIGRLLDALDASPYRDDTVVVLWSDHGYHLGEKRHWRKWSLWEESTRVPLAIAAPGVGRPGAGTGRAASLLDIYPTLLDLCGLPAREQLEGESLVPVLREPALGGSRAVVTTRGYHTHAVRDRHWRYFRYRDGSEELYDHRSDPNEWRNLAGDARFRGEKQRLARWLPERDAALEHDGLMRWYHELRQGLDL